MATEEEGGQRTGASPKASREKLIIGGVAGLVILLILLRARSAGSSSSTTSSATPYAVPSGMYAGPGLYGSGAGGSTGGASATQTGLNPSDPTIAALLSLLSLQGASSAIPANQNASPNTGPTIAPAGVPAVGQWGLATGLLSTSSGRQIYSGPHGEPGYGLGPGTPANAILGPYGAYYIPGAAPDPGNVGALHSAGLA